MSAPERHFEAHERLLTFEVGGHIYALPIGCVVEVSDSAPLACIPTLSRDVGGVMNHHGDALPVLRRSIFFDVKEEDLPPPGHVLALAARGGGGARWGIPVDRIVGLVDGSGASALGEDPVAERREIDERIVFVLDPQRLLERARRVIEGASGQ